MGRKFGGCPFRGGEAGSPPNTMWPPAYQVSSWSVQPFGHSARTSQTGQTRQRSDSIGRTVLQTVAQTLHTFVRGAGGIKLGTLVILLVKQMSNISQGSVNPATCFRCGGHLSDNFIANSLTSLTVKEFWKSVTIWRTHGRESWVSPCGPQVFAQTRRVLCDGNCGRPME